MTPDPTGKERDSETGLDFFGARYFSGAQGRFTTPDWSDKPAPVPYADLTNPQSLNLYAYVLNNPLTRVDPLGHFDCTGKNAQGIGCQYIANWNVEHGISNTAKKQDPAAPGVPVKLPNGKTVNNPYTNLRSEQRSGEGQRDQAKGNTLCRLGTGPQWGYNRGSS